MFFMLTRLAQESSDGSGGGLFSSLFGLIIAVLAIAGLWKTFTKAGQPGWAVLIPIYNTIVLLRIAGRPAWWFLLMLIPFVNFVIFILVALDIAKAFGKSTLFAIGLILLAPIFFAILGFGDARYIGPQGVTSPAFT